jgi:hypothetical protein
MTPRVTERQARTRMGREKMISQIPPKQPESPTPALRGEPVLTPLTWSDIKNWGVRSSRLGLTWENGDLADGLPTG